jgi:GxxExxY protein
MENREPNSIPTPPPTKPALLHAELTRSVIAAFYTVYNTLGFGFLEAVYTGAMTIELRKRGHNVKREVHARVYYDDIAVAWYRADILVDDVLIVEAKSTRHLDPTATDQLENCLRATDLELGPLFHFGPKPRFYIARLRHTALALDRRRFRPIRPVRGSSKC